MQTIEEIGLDAGQLVLSPTRTYAPLVKRILEEVRTGISGMIHCSGGAQTKVMHFVDNMHIVKDNLFDIPPLFRIIQEESQTPWKEMYQVFNMGHRFEIYTEERLVDTILDISSEYNIDAQVIGYCEAASGKSLTIKTEKGVFHY